MYASVTIYLPGKVAHIVEPIGTPGCLLYIRVKHTDITHNQLT